jgi:hypothetical protein
MKQCAVMFAAVEAMANADAVRLARGFEANVAAQATAG